MKNKKLLRKLKRKEQSLYNAGNNYIKKHWGGARGAYYVMREFGANECEDAEFYFWHQSDTFVEGWILYEDGYCYAGPIYPPDYSDKTIKYFRDKISDIYNQIYDLEWN